VIYAEASGVDKREREREREGGREIAARSRIKSPAGSTGMIIRNPRIGAIDPRDPSSRLDSRDIVPHFTSGTCARVAAALAVALKAP